ncbi:MAG: hypothetical protein Q7T82_04010 [Armatimonadota bacterium]|nr:hypothetical protein [Armatimonadota bacterium]
MLIKTLGWPAAGLTLPFRVTGSFCCAWVELFRRSWHTTIGSMSVQGGSSGG